MLKILKVKTAYNLPAIPMKLLDERNSEIHGFCEHGVVATGKKTKETYMVPFAQIEFIVVEHPNKWEQDVEAALEQDEPDPIKWVSK